MAKASGMPSAAKKDQQHQKDEHCHSCVFSPFRLCVVTAQRLILGRKVGNIGLVQGDDLDHDADGTDDAAHRHDAVHIHHGDLHALTDLFTGNAHILEALIGEHQHHGQHDEVIDDSQPALAGRLDAVVKDVDHDVLVLDHVDAHAPEGGKGKQGGVELCQLLPAQGEAVARNNGKDHKSCQQCHGDHADGKVYVKQLLADFFQLFDGAQPLSVILQLFPLACYSRGQPAGCPLAFTVTWPFLPLVVSAYAFATISCISLISSAVQMPSVTHWSYTDCTAVWKAFSSSAEGS